MFIAIIKFILSEAEDRKMIGTCDTCRISRHQW